MTSKKYLFVLSSIVFLAYSSNYTNATKGDIITQEGTVFKPLKSFESTLSNDLKPFSSPIAISEKFQDGFRTTGIFAPAGPEALAIMTTIDHEGSLVSRTLGVNYHSEKDVLSFNTNPDSQKMMHINANNNVAIYQVWHTPEKSRQISFSGIISPSSKSDSINISLNKEGPYNSQWKKYFFTPHKATVSQLTHHYSEGKAYCVIERIDYTNQFDGTWKAIKRSPYVALNSYKFKAEDLASAKKN